MSLELIKEKLKNNIDNFGVKNNRFKIIINTLKGEAYEDEIKQPMTPSNGLVEEIHELVNDLQKKIDTYTEQITDIADLVYKNTNIVGCDRAQEYKPKENQ